MSEERSNSNGPRRRYGRRRRTTSSHSAYTGPVVWTGRVAPLLFVLTALGGVIAGPAHADPGPCGGTCAPPPPPPLVVEPAPPVAPVPPLVAEPAPKPKRVTVYHNTRAYSTPYFNALKSTPLRAATYVATCEANSGSRGRYSNPWWSRLASGYWVNNGDLSGPDKMSIGDCNRPRNDRLSVVKPKARAKTPQQPSGKSTSPKIILRTFVVPHTRGLDKVRAFDVYFNKQNTRDIAAGEGLTVLCAGLLTFGPPGVAVGTICAVKIWTFTYAAGRAIDRKKCLKVRFPVPVSSVGTAVPSEALPGFHGGTYCT